MTEKNPAAPPSAGFINVNIDCDENAINKMAVKHPKIIVVNEFDPASVTRFAQDVNTVIDARQSIVPIVIDSYGGAVYSLLPMIDIIKKCTIPVATIVIGKAMSCGAVLFSCGSEGLRFMAPNATVMIHDVSSWVVGKVSEVQSDAKETKRLDNLVYRIMSNNCGKENSYFKKIVHDKNHADWYLTPKEALKHNLANHIKIPQFNIKISLETTLL